MNRFLLFILLLCPLALHSQSSFLIPVQTTTGQGISGATVTLTCKDTTNGCVGKGPFSATSNNGNATFTAIPSGNYTVAITGPNLAVLSYALTIGGIVPTITIKQGTGAGNYSTSSTSYVNVDGTNLVNNVLVPVGWKLLISASGSSTISTGAATLFVSLLDNLIPTTLVESECTVDSVGFFRTWALNWVITGDGAIHTIVLQFKTANASDAASVINSSSTNIPTMTFLLTPSD